MEQIVEVKDIMKTFKLSKKQQKIEGKNKRKVALNRINLTVNRGEVYALLGPNGAGKTTMLRILSTLMQPDEGDCFISGISVTNFPDEVRKSIGFLTSELKLEDFFTPNYLFDFFSELHGISAEVRDKRKIKIFNTLGIDRFAEVKVANLSTGMKQKVSIAVSLVNDPEIIIFDEPTNGLDIITAKVVIDYLLSLKKEGKTIILSTHIFSLVEKMADRIGIIIDGRMICEKQIDELTMGKSLEDVFFDIYVNEVKIK